MVLERERGESMSESEYKKKTLDILIEVQKRLITLSTEVLELERNIVTLCKQLNTITDLILKED